MFFFIDKVVLWLIFRIEKVINIRNRVYVFELIIGDKYLCLLVDE